MPTTTTTTTTSTTTATTAPPLGQHLTFTTAVGTVNCALPTPDPPFSGEIDSDTAGTTKISDLGAGCLYIGGGAASIPPSIIPENAASILDSSDGTTLTASFGTGPADCTRGRKRPSAASPTPPSAARPMLTAAARSAPAPRTPTASSVRRSPSTGSRRPAS